MDIRRVTGHEVKECNATLTITADAPSHGGASHEFLIRWPVTHGPDAGAVAEQTIVFQNGPVPEVGTNGITHEVLLTIVLNRLNAFQSGEYRCRENALAITKLEEALHWLHHRTQARTKRGVEGTHTP